MQTALCSCLAHCQVAAALPLADTIENVKAKIQVGLQREAVPAQQWMACCQGLGSASKTAAGGCDSAQCSSWGSVWVWRRVPSPAGTCRRAQQQ